MKINTRLVVALNLVAGLILAGCGSTRATYQSGDVLVEIETDTFLKNVTDAQLKWGEVEANLGGSTSTVDQRLIACLLAPELEGCQ